MNAKGMRTLGSTKMKKEKVMSTVKETTTTPDTPSTGGEGDNNQG